MSSNLLNSIGLGNLDIAYILIGMIAFIIIILILLIIQMNKLSKLQKKYRKFMSGKGASSMEEKIMELFEDIKDLKVCSSDNSKEIRNLYKRLETTYQKIGIVKYDAFQQMGGQLSFSLALLNENNDGFIMNSVHSTDGCYSYTKEIRGGECKIPLGEEEQKALNKAISGE